MTEPAIDPRSVPSESWTGGEPTDPGRTRLDDWSDAHPWTTIALAVGGLAVISTMEAAGRLHMSSFGLVLFFEISWLTPMAACGGLIGGAVLFAKLTGRIKHAAIGQKTALQKRYLSGLLVVLFFFSVWIGPVIVFKLLSSVGIALK